MSTIFTKAFWEASAERAVKTLIQTALASGIIGAAGFTDVDWASVASVSGLAALVSVLTSIASSGVGGDGPSLTTETIEPKAE